MVICGDCGEGFKNILLFKDHEAIHTQLSYKCDICKENFRTVLEFEEHKERFHDTQISYECKNCNKSMESSDKLKNHECVNHEVVENTKCSHDMVKGEHEYQMLRNISEDHATIKNNIDRFEGNVRSQLGI